MRITKIIFSIILFLFSGINLYSFPLTNSTYTIEQDVCSGGGSVFTQKNATYSIEEDVIAQAGPIGSSFYSSSVLAHGYMGGSLSGTVDYINSVISFPENNSLVSHIENITGTCRSATTIDRVYLTLERLSDDLYFDGTAWQTEEKWLLATGTGDFSFPVSKDAFTHNCQYRIIPKGIDILGMEEGSRNSSLFTFVYSLEFERSVCNFPNPFFPSSSDGNKNSTTIEYYLENDDSVEIRIYNFNYDLVKELKARDMNSKGIHHLSWDGLDKNGNKVSSGVYFLVIKTRTKKVVNKIALIN